MGNYLAFIKKRILEEGKVWTPHASNAGREHEIQLGDKLEGHPEVLMLHGGHATHGHTKGHVTLHKTGFLGDKHEIHLSHDEIKALHRHFVEGKQD